MGFDFEAIRSAFFDAPAVKKAMDDKQAKALPRMGAFVRKRIKSSLRYRTKPSAPGSTPSVHRGAFTKTSTNKKTGVKKTQAASPLRELQFFAYDRLTKSVVVGPAIFRKSSVVPRALEKGGTVSTTKPVPGPERQKARSGAQAEAYRRKIQDGSIIVPKWERIRVEYHLAARPSTLPAMQAELPKFANLLRG